MAKGTPISGVNKGWFKKGVVFSEEYKQKIRDGCRRANSHPKWKGDDLLYGSLHDWVYTVLGRPDRCKRCNTDGLTGHQIHWANKSGQYRRESTDWIRLCVKCHSRYDRIKRLLLELKAYEEE